MNKKVLILLFIINILFLSSCSIGGSRTDMLNNQNDDKKADARLEKVIEAIKSKDKEALRTMFSKQAQKDAENLDGRMEYLFNFFQGEVKSWNNINGAPTIHETSDNGHKTKKVKSYYYVNTDKQKYFFYISEFTVDTDKPDNVGLYTLLVIKAEDKEKQWDNGSDDTFLPGIYKPKE